MILPVIYSVLVWALAMRWRRRWPAFAVVTGGLIVLAGMYRVYMAWGEKLSPQYKHILILYWPYVVLVGVVGFYIACLPRRAREHECQRCGYDLRGLNPAGLSCPECGADWCGPGSGREPPVEPLIAIPTGKPRNRTVL